MLGIPFPGAVNKTLLAPFEDKCLFNSSKSLKAPVLSITNASLI